MKPHDWQIEKRDHGPACPARFWVCRGCGADGGPVVGRMTEPLEEARVPGSSGAGREVSDDCEMAARAITLAVSAPARFSEAFPDEWTCLMRFRQLRWPAGFVCDGCGGTTGYWIKRRMAYFCDPCRKLRPVRAHTLLHKTHLDVRTWFAGAWLLARYPGITVARFQSVLQLSSFGTAFQLRRRITDAMAEAPPRVFDELLALLALPRGDR